MLNNGTELMKKENAAMQETVGQRGFHPIFSPLTDVKENEREYVMTLEMPGVGEKDIDVTIDHSVLTVQGHAQRTVVEGAQLAYSEYNEGSYRRMFTLSSTVDANRITAKMKDGVLTLTLPKAESAKARKIAVCAT